MAFYSGSNNSLMSHTVLRKRVHLEHNPLVSAEYTALGSSPNLKATEGLLPNPQPCF